MSNEREDKQRCIKLAANLLLLASVDSILSDKTIWTAKGIA